ncbi:MAG: phosphoenolpyruvate carboxykinase (GTP) [Zetaproteobacteria bacterium]|nr:phosphoenolpyruvate carboxykinase (GTP) [Pseudobdellovibrionaceae bacterium]
MSTSNASLKNWVTNVAELTNPDKIKWCFGNDEEVKEITDQMLRSGDLHRLNPEKYPNSYLYRSDPNDVARTEHLTFVCTKDKDDVGPNNNWMSVEDAYKKSENLFSNSMKGRTMYIVPYCMGPYASPYARLGVEITDSPYVVLNMAKMTRMGLKAKELIEKGKPFIKGLHCTGDLSLEKRLILHFPEDGEIHSFSSGYGGNALLGKKCHALRLASWQAKQEGWLAEHMLIVGIENPEGEKTYVAAAFPSACGKTNLAMLVPPKEYKGWKVWTIGDDIAWLNVGEDGRLYAINPEAGFFGVAPGTSKKTNPRAYDMITANTIFTNVALTTDNTPWWEGKDSELPTVNWKGEECLKGDGKAYFAHPNSRFTVSSKNCKSYSKDGESPYGVPISAIIFGGRRPSRIPLVYEAKSWTHGVFVGASVCSQTTAAATGKIGVLRHDPMAMKPFCGYHFGDYWAHWIRMKDKCRLLPKVFHVNWFRKDEHGKFVWPGFGENIRVLEWILKRAKGTGEAVNTPIGYVPQTGEINIDGLKIKPETLQEICDVLPSGWKEECEEIESYLKKFEPKVPRELWIEFEKIKKDVYT